MADTTGPAPSRGFRLPTLAELNRSLRSTDIGLAIGIMGIIVVLILPLPAVLLDVLLAVSIVFSVLILMTALFIQTPLEFSSFPTVLLIATMLRLALNLATTRLILSEGLTGHGAAGHCEGDRTHRAGCVAGCENAGHGRLRSCVRLDERPHRTVLQRTAQFFGERT